MDSIAERLRAERNKLGLSQTEFAAIAGVKRNAQMNYENGTRVPDVAYMAALANNGVDVTFVITGRVTASSLDIERELMCLSDAWQAIDEALANAKKTMASDKKRQVADAIYKAVKSGDGEAKTLAELLTKAA